MPKRDDILTFLAYGLPVAGGLAGMVVVNLNLIGMRAGL